MISKIACILLISLCSFSFAQLDDSALFDLFQSWQNDHSVQYASVEEEQYRFDVFKSNYLLIQAHNAAGNTATLGLNRFADLSNEEFAAKYVSGYKKPADYVQPKADIEALKAMIQETYPATLDWRTKGVVPPVGDEGQCGSTWAWSAVQSVDAFHAIKSNDKLTVFSVSQVNDCDTKSMGCNGGFPTNALSYIVSEGLETSEEYPYHDVTGKCKYNASLAQHVLKTWSVIPPKSLNLTQAAVSKTPISACIEADQNVFQLYTGGVITTGCGAQIDHCIVIVGWTNVNGTNAWICENQWGNTWGDQGYVYIAMDQSANSGQGVCGIYAEQVTPLS